MSSKAATSACEGILCLLSVPCSCYRAVVPFWARKQNGCGSHLKLCAFCSQNDNKYFYKLSSLLLPHMYDITDAFKLDPRFSQRIKHHFSFSYHDRVTATTVDDENGARAGSLTPASGQGRFYTITSGQPRKRLPPPTTHSPRWFLSQSC